MNPVRRDALRCSTQPTMAAQVALSWLLTQHPWVVPIPGTTKVHRLQENLAAVDVELSADDLAALSAASDEVDVLGDRYPEHMQKWINR